MHFLVPVDLSEHSKTTAEQAAYFALRHAADITLLYIKETSSSFRRFLKKDSSEQLTDFIQTELDKIKNSISEISKKTVTSIVASGKVYETILEKAEELKVDKIIMGMNGSYRINRFIGTNALRVVKQSKIPVLIIKGEKLKSAWENIVLPLDLTKETTEKVDYAIEEAKKIKGGVLRIVAILKANDYEIHQRLVKQM